MIQSVSISPVKGIYKTQSQAKLGVTKSQNNVGMNQTVSFGNVAKIHNLHTKLSQSEKEKYIYLVNVLRGVAPSPNSENTAPTKQLEILLKNGKLLSKSNNDNSTTLDNLYEMVSTQRAEGIDSVRVLCDTLDILTNPRIITQKFGDIPSNEKPNILAKQEEDSQVKKQPGLMDVYASGTCCAASNEVNMADKYPAEFARWVSKLSSKDKELYLNVDLKSISKDPLEASLILKLLGADNQAFGFKKNKIKVTLDDNAYVRAQIQGKYWDPGERNIADVLVQSAIMRLGSQNTYDSLTDTRAAIFNSNTQGLVEVEKTYVESLFKNKEITSLVYQVIDEDQNLVGYTTSFDKIAQHITDTIDSGDDVIIGYVLTNETAGIIPNFKDKNTYSPNRVINGHEITIVDYIKDKSGKINFVCVDTDDDSKDFVIYSGDWLLPKIHHAGYPANIVKEDEKEIMRQINAA